MLLYIFAFFCVLAVYFLFPQGKYSSYVLFFELLLLALFVGMSDMLGGYDRYIYAELFDNMANETMVGNNPWLSESFFFYRGEFGYGTLSALITFFTANRYIFILIVTLIIYLLLFLSLKKYTENYSFAVILFMGLWFFFTFTYLRQVLAATTAWLAVRYIITRDFKKFLLVWLIAYSFHNSALVFFPMYFVPMKKYSLPFVYRILFVAFILGLTPIPRVIFETYGEIDSFRVGVEQYVDQGTFRFAYLLEVLFFMYFISLYYKKIPQHPFNITMLNLALVFCIIMLVFIRSENGGRLSWYYLIGIISTMTTLSVDKMRLTGTGKVMIVICFLLFYRILGYWGVMIAPYKSFLSDGHREHDPVFLKYEYDYNYDLDKFYR